MHFNCCPESHVKHESNCSSISLFLSLSLTNSLGNDGFGCVIVMIRMNSMRNCLAQHDENVHLNNLLPRLAVWFIYFYTPRREARSKD